jgi:hypothetical protein
VTRGSRLFFRSLFYEGPVLTHLEKVQPLPPELQAEIAMRVSNFIALARTVSQMRPGFLFMICDP